MMICSAQIAAGKVPITINHHSAYNRAITVHEFSGIATAPAKDKSSTGIGNSTASTSNATATTTQANELLIGAIGVGGTASEGFTADNANFSGGGGPFRVGTTAACCGQLNRTINVQYKIVSDSGAGGNALTGNLTVDANATLDATAVNHYNLTAVNATLNASGSYLAQASTISLSGNWSNAGSFSAGTSTVTLNGANQNITGSTTFNNFTKSVAAADTLTFASGSTTTINGLATLNGAAGQLLSLRSSSTPTRWAINLAGTKSISYVDVKDSDASGSSAGNKPVAPANAANSGNNLNWFPTPSISVLKSSTVISDPVNGATSPLHIPGAIVSYQVQTTNSGTGSPDANTVVVTDVIDSATLDFDVTAGIIFTANTSGLTLGTVSYSQTSTPATYTYTPTGPYDPNVAGIKITTTGTFATAGANFTVSYKVRVK